MSGGQARSFVRSTNSRPRITTRTKERSFVSPSSNDTLMSIAGLDVIPAVEDGEEDGTAGRRTTRQIGSEKPAAVRVRGFLPAIIWEQGSHVQAAARTGAATQSQCKSVRNTTRQRPLGLLHRQNSRQTVGGGEAAGENPASRFSGRRPWLARADSKHNLQALFPSNVNGNKRMAEASRFSIKKRLRNQYKEKSMLSPSRVNSTATRPNCTRSPPQSPSSRLL